MTALLHQPQNLLHSKHKIILFKTPPSIPLPFWAFLFSLKSSDEVANTRRCNSSNPISPSVSLWGFTVQHSTIHMDSLSNQPTRRKHLLREPGIRWWWPSTKTLKDRLLALGQGAFWSFSWGKERQTRYALWEIRELVNWNVPFVVSKGAEGIGLYILHKISSYGSL